MKGSTAEVLIIETLLLLSVISMPWRRIEVAVSHLNLTLS